MARKVDIGGRQPAARIPRAWFVALAVALAGVGLGIEDRMRREIREQAIAQLAAVADFKTDQLVAWRAERLADVAAIAAPPDGPANLARLARGEPTAPVAAWYRSIQERHLYADVMVVSARGEALFSTAGPAAPLDPETAATAARALSEGGAVLSDLHRSPRDGRVYLDAAAPIPAGERARAALVLRTDPETFLFPMLQSWPAPSPSLETVLLREDGDHLLVLNELRHVRGAALSLRFPGSSAGVLAQAPGALGTRGTREGEDYRGVAVLGAMRAVPGSPWRLAAKIDHDEIFSAERHLAWAAWAAVGAFLALGGLLARIWWRAERHARAAAARASQLEALRIRAEVLENVYDAVISTDAASRITSWNRAAERVYGWTEAEALGRSVQEILQIEHGPAQTRSWMLGELERHGRVELTVQQRRKDGAPVEVEATVVATRGADGTLLGYIAVNRDVTERRGAEAELKRVQARLALADRMASVGTLASGVAHEINNPLASLIANLGAAREAAQSLGPAPLDLGETLREARDAAERVRRIVGELRTFSRSDEAAAHQPVDVRQVLDAAVNLARHEIRHRARLVKEYGEVPPVEANEGRLAQAFLNLIVNAAQAIPEGHADAHQIRVAAHPAEGRVRVQVSDSGAGIPPEHLGRIFDPFFTTKEVGVGTGLGLSICHGIVTSLGGEIRADSAPGKGSTFTVLLPAASDLAEPLPPAPSAPLAPVPDGRRGRVLVVDDEPALATTLRRVLSRDHDVVTAASGKAALELVLRGERFDVILCDLMMPEVTGMDLHERLVEEAPEAARVMVFMTGGAFTARASAFLNDPSRRRIDKPFDPQALRALVRELVGP